MQITYEPGDIVEVMDDHNAGDFSACTVELINRETKSTWNVWLVQAPPGGLTPPQTGTVEEIYFT